MITRLHNRCVFEDGGVRELYFLSQLAPELFKPILRHMRSLADPFCLTELSPYKKQSERSRTPLGFRLCFQLGWIPLI